MPEHDSAEVRAFSKLLPMTLVSTASIGASAAVLDARARSVEITRAWEGLHKHLEVVPPPPPPPPPPPLPSQLGPFTWNPIVLGGGVPIGGWAQLTLFDSGDVNFSGHFHVSGAPSYNVTCTFVIRTSDGRKVYTFTKTGRVHGTFESGSRNFDWQDNPNFTEISENWESLAAGWSWQAKAGANADVRALVESAIQTVGEAAAVIALIA